MEERILEKIEYLQADIFATEAQIASFRKNGIPTFLHEECVQSMERELSVLIWILNTKSNQLYHNGN